MIVCTVVISLSITVDASVGTESVAVLGDIVDIKSVIDFTVVVMISVTDVCVGTSVVALISSVVSSSLFSF